MNIFAINSISSNLKMKRFRMPNAAYLNRCASAKEKFRNKNIVS